MVSGTLGLHESSKRVCLCDSPEVTDCYVLLILSLVPSQRGRTGIHNICILNEYMNLSRYQYFNKHSGNCTSTYNESVFAFGFNDAISMCVLFFSC